MSKSLSKLAYYLNSIDLSIESKNVLSILKLAQEDEFLNSKGKVTEVSLHTAKSNGMYNFEVLPDEKQFFIYSDGDKLDNQENIKRISEGIMKGQYKLDQHLLNYFKRGGFYAISDEISFSSIRNIYNQVSIEVLISDRSSYIFQDGKEIVVSINIPPNEEINRNAVAETYYHEMLHLVDSFSHNFYKDTHDNIIDSGGDHMDAFRSQFIEMSVPKSIGNFVFKFLYKVLGYSYNFLRSMSNEDMFDIAKEISYYLLYESEFSTETAKEYCPNKDSIPEDKFVAICKAFWELNSSSSLGRFLAKTIKSSSDGYFHMSEKNHQSLTLASLSSFIRYDLNRRNIEFNEGNIYSLLMNLFKMKLSRNYYTNFERARIVYGMNNIAETRPERIRDLARGILNFKRR